MFLFVVADMANLDDIVLFVVVLLVVDTSSLDNFSLSTTRHQPPLCFKQRQQQQQQRQQQQQQQQSQQKQQLKSYRTEKLSKITVLLKLLLSFLRPVWITFRCDNFSVVAFVVIAVVVVVVAVVAAITFLDLKVQTARK